MPGREPIMPSEVSNQIGRFDRFASAASRVASRAYFFVACVLLVLIWVPSYFLFGNVDTWQLIINTATTIITFLMVALLQNSQTRADHALQHKLNAIADALADLMEHLATDTDARDLMSDRAELKQAVGLEAHESTTHNRSDEQ
jgi:low affinity Fe/Cu permease